MLSQVLMASTYPLEVVHAARWVKANPNVKGDAAVKAVENQPWDVSVKSLVAFPQVLEPMNDKLDWTQKLGDAFLAQQKDVLAAVQRLRASAQDIGQPEDDRAAEGHRRARAGGRGQTQTIVRIEPANPQVIYVPAYNPTVVYGAGAIRPTRRTTGRRTPAYYPGAALATGIAWGVGLAAAGAIFGNCNWGGGNVNINVDKAANIDRNFDRSKVQGQAAAGSMTPATARASPIATTPRATSLPGRRRAPTGVPSIAGVVPIQVRGQAQPTGPAPGTAHRPAIDPPAVAVQIGGTSR